MGDEVLATDPFEGGIRKDDNRNTARTTPFLTDGTVTTINAVRLGADFKSNAAAIAGSCDHS